MLSDGAEVLQSIASLPFPAQSRIPVSTMPRILFTMQEKSISSSSHGTTCFSRVIRREAKFMCSVRASSSTTALFTSSSPPMSLVPVSAPAPTVTSWAPLLLEASDDRPLEPSVQGPEGETLPQLSGGPDLSPIGANWSRVCQPTSLQSAPASLPLVPFQFRATSSNADSSLVSRARLLIRALQDISLEPSVQGPEGETLPQLSGGPGPNPLGAGWSSSSQVVSSSQQAPSSPTSPLPKKPTWNRTRKDWDSDFEFQFELYKVSEVQERKELFLAWTPREQRFAWTYSWGHFREEQRSWRVEAGSDASSQWQRDLTQDGDIHSNPGPSLSSSTSLLFQLSGNDFIPSSSCRWRPKKRKPRSKPSARPAPAPCSVPGKQATQVPFQPSKRCSNQQFVCEHCGQTSSSRAMPTNNTFPATAELAYEGFNSRKVFAPPSNFRVSLNRPRRRFYSAPSVCPENRAPPSTSSCHATGNRNEDPRGPILPTRGAPRSHPPDAGTQRMSRYRFPPQSTKTEQLPPHPPAQRLEIEMKTLEVRSFQPRRAA